MGDTYIDAKALDGEDMLRVMRTKIEPQLAEDASTNTGQIARILEEALAKYRSRTS
jgi:hypothetical protein